MRTALLPIPDAETTTIVSEGQAPAFIAVSNVGVGPGANGTVYVSPEPEAHATGAGVPVALNEMRPFRVDRPIYAFCDGDPTEILVTYLPVTDELV